LENGKLSCKRLKLWPNRSFYRKMFEFEMCLLGHIPPYKSILGPFRTTKNLTPRVGSGSGSCLFSGVGSGLPQMLTTCQRIQATNGLTHSSTHLRYNTCRQMTFGAELCASVQRYVTKVASKQQKVQRIMYGTTHVII
jgi:hypothetical protein